MKSHRPPRARCLLYELGRKVESTLDGDSERSELLIALEGMGHASGK